MPGMVHGLPRMIKQWRYALPAIVIVAYFSVVMLYRQQENLKFFLPSTDDLTLPLIQKNATPRGNVSFHSNNNSNNNSTIGRATVSSLQRHNTTTTPSDSSRNERKQHDDLEHHEDPPKNNQTQKETFARKTHPEPDIPRKNQTHKETLANKTHPEPDIHNSTVAFLPLFPWEQTSMDIFQTIQRDNITFRSKVEDRAFLQPSCQPPPGVPRHCCMGSTSRGGMTADKYRSACTIPMLHHGPLVKHVQEQFIVPNAGCDVCRIMELARHHKLNIAFWGDSVHGQNFDGFLCELSRRAYQVETNTTFKSGFGRYNFQLVCRLEVMSPQWEKGEKVNVTFYKQYRLPSSDPAEFAALLDFADVIILGFGLHYNDRSGRDALLEFNRNFANMRKYLNNQTSNASPPRLLIHRESNAQHFNTTDGTFEKGAHVGEPCVPRRGGPVSSFRDRAMLQSFIAAKFLNVYAAPPLKYDTNTNTSSLLVSRATETPQLDLWAIPFYNYSEQHYEMHPTSDCTHICHTPIFWYPIWHGIRRAMDATFETTKEL